MKTCPVFYRFFISNRLFLPYRSRCLPLLFWACSKFFIFSYGDWQKRVTCLAPLTEPKLSHANPNLNSWNPNKVYELKFSVIKSLIVQKLKSIPVHRYKSHMWRNNRVHIFIHIYISSCVSNYLSVLWFLSLIDEFAIGDQLRNQLQILTNVKKVAH